MRATLGLLALLTLAGPAAADMTPAPPRTRMPPAPSADREHERGLAASRAKEWSVAEAAFTRAIELQPTHAPAWNGLGFALRNQGRYPESLRAYDQALRLRPDYPEALEYLGEAYVKLGRLDDARRVLERLQRLDPGMAAELAEVIAKGK